MFQEAVYY